MAEGRTAGVSGVARLDVIGLTKSSEQKEKTPQGVGEGESEVAEEEAR